MGAARIGGALQATAAMVLLVGCVGCTALLEPEVVGERTPLPVQALYAEAHAHAEACTGASFPFEEIRWYSAPEIRLNGRRYLGAWDAPDVIVLAEGCERCPRVVYHELLHAVLQRGHPGDGWNGTAAGCEEAWERATAP